jgi:hypothetical protein
MTTFYHFYIGTQRAGGGGAHWLLNVADRKGTISQIYILVLVEVALLG